MRMRHPVALVVLAWATLLPSQGLAQFTQHGPKLVGTGAVGPALEGFAVALSADGDTAIVGGVDDNDTAGAVWVWTRSGGVWMQQSPKLVGAAAVGGSRQGFSVALSADGNTAIVGGKDDDLEAGAVWIWTRNGGVWTQQSPKLVGAGAAGNAQQGRSVVLSADGNTAIVGGYQDDGGAGAVWVWTRNAGVWTQQSGKLVGAGAIGKAQQGRSVALSADGSTLVAGGYADDNNAGAAWVWTRSGDTWTQQTKMVASDAVAPAQQGTSVALSADGNTVIVGGFADNSNTGAAWVWTRSEGLWTQQSKLIGSGAEGIAEQGFSVSLSADGNTAIVGGILDNSFAGAVWIWKRSAGVWTQRSNKVVGSGAEGAAQQGVSVSLSTDGNTAIVGGYRDNNGLGAVWVFSADDDPGALRRHAVRH